MDPFLAEVRIFPYNFAPKAWAFCNGQLLPISQNTALFALLGTFYGGDGKSTFALPDVQGCTVVDNGQGPGLSERLIGEQGGAEFITLLQSEIPVHTHNLLGTGSQASTTIPPVDGCLARGVGGNPYVPGAPNQLMAPQALAPTGGSLPHNNLMPYLVFNYCIALQGIFPPRA